ncbi:MAG: DUF3311 domain-containing protein [Planctomycetota bacterium]|nr:MAG: DUF3311 domain-containing protein [Planctomycetota bacterium]
MGKRIVWGLVLLLIILHQDVWFWESDYLVLGVVPIGLFYHACLSVAAGVVWYLATLYAWPLDDISSVSKEAGE